MTDYKIVINPTNLQAMHTLEQLRHHFCFDMSFSAQRFRINVETQMIR